MNIIELINYLALFVWGSFTVFVLLGMIASFHKVPKAAKMHRRHRFVIVSIASWGVEKALLDCIAHTRSMFPRSKIYILIDEGADMQSYLQKHNKNVIVVPKKYRRDLLAKGRAINYFIRKYVDKTFWYSFIDDDNLIADKKFLYEIPVMEAKGYIAMNPILKARPGKSSFSFIMDAMRYFDDLTIYRFFTGLLSRPILGLHGELLTVKGSILKKIGFAHHSFTEDFRFAIELMRGGYKVWQSSTIVSIKSPNSVRDLLKQRGRWFKGIVLDLRHAPLVMQIMVGWRTVVWILGLFGSWLFSAFWFQFHYNSILLIPGGLYFWFVYIWGVKEARAWKYLSIIPLFGIIEAISFVSGLRHKQFEVINKN